jgi:zinc transport system ATP-binding protein
MNLDKKEILIKLENVGINQDNKWLVHDVSLEIERGKILTLIGPNGSGKTTTAKIALGIHKNIKGKVTKNTNKIGYVPQKISIDWTLPIRVIDFMSLTQTLQFDEVVSALRLTEVEHLKHNDLRSLSGGEFQRVLIALYELIKKISDELNCGILLISHDLNVVMSKTDYVVCLNGHVCCSGTPMNVANNKNYKELFGDQASTLLSVYEHKHDHTHSTDGSINEKKH